MYLIHHGGADVNPAFTEDRQLALALLNSIDQRPALMSGVARMTLYGSRLYGERKGESLSAVQQKSLISQTLCRLIYQEGSITLRIAKIFAAYRDITQREFVIQLQVWPYTDEHERERTLWETNYEALEIPSLYLKSHYNVRDASAGAQDGPAGYLDLDNLVVGSLSWTLMQFGARAMALDDPAKLSSTTSFKLIESGIGLVGLFLQGRLIAGMEPNLYLGLILYYLRARPELSLKRLLAEDTLEPAFALLKEELDTRYFAARRLYDNVAFFHKEFQRATWRSRKAAAEAWVKLRCGGAQPLVSDPGQESRPDETALTAYRSCLESSANDTAIDLFYFQEVDRFAKEVCSRDEALLSAAFTPSDVLNDQLQWEEERYLQRAGIEGVTPRLAQRSCAQDGPSSIAPMNYQGKPGTFFFQAKDGWDHRLFALQTTNEGYLLRRIPLHDNYLSGLKPFMANWPRPESVPEHEFTLLPLNNTDIGKRPQETLATFLERYATSHYLSYRQKMYESGYTGGPASALDNSMAASGYVIPSYGCVKAIMGYSHGAFAECQTKGPLMGMPSVFAGVRGGLDLFKTAAVGAGRTFSELRSVAVEHAFFRNEVPATSQMGGGIVATRAQIKLFTDILGRAALKSADPGFASLDRLGILSKDLYLALLGRAAVGINRQHNRAKKIDDTARYFSNGALPDFHVAFSQDGGIPQAFTVKGITYSVLQVEYNNIIAVETGERNADGQIIFVQLDMQNQHSIFKKYYCLHVGNMRCQLYPARPPGNLIEVEDETPRLTGQYQSWLLRSHSSIHHVVVYPFHQLDYADRQWVTFEINDRRWAFSWQDGTLIVADNIDDWRISLRQGIDRVSMITRGNDNRSLWLRLTSVPQRRKRDISLLQVQDIGSRLANYTLDEEENSDLSAIVHDELSLNVQIGVSRYLVSLEQNAGTFLLRHPKQNAMPKFRVAYRVDGGAFVFVSPLEPVNARPLGEALRQKIIDNPKATQEALIDIQLPPLVNGAFRYGKKMFLKVGDRMLTIVPSEGGVSYSAR
ncbi:hypothetical protein ABK905_02080 [Acerihabitans sp. KWT182]|uniref:Uncharacterized protein n=1 Tax=Acerihabitans sp. KWT182 TaxID=3157919 RepID=A0AAU7QD40_9GAMM